MRKKSRRTKKLLPPRQRPLAAHCRRRRPRRARRGFSACGATAAPGTAGDQSALHGGPLVSCPAGPLLLLLLLYRPNAAAAAPTPTAAAPTPTAAAAAAAARARARRRARCSACLSTGLGGWPLHRRRHHRPLGIGWGVREERRGEVDGEGEKRRRFSRELLEIGAPRASSWGGKCAPGRSRGTIGGRSFGERGKTLSVRVRNGRVFALWC
jgi:hypothetical protein